MEAPANASGVPRLENRARAVNCGRCATRPGSDGVFRASTTESRHVNATSDPYALAHLAAAGLVLRLWPVPQSFVEALRILGPFPEHRMTVYSKL